MSIKEIIKKSVLENFTNNNFSVKEIFFLMAVSALLGLFIYLVYRLVTSRGFYSKAFSVSLIVLGIITTGIILTIQTSIVVSLGMVGALSIVRFRTAVKNPLDLVFTFWSISVGIVVGAGLPVVAVGMSLVIAIILVLFLNVFTGSKARLIHVRGSFDKEAVTEIVKKYDRNVKIQSENYMGESTDVLFLVKVKETADLINELRGTAGVNAVLSIEHTEGQF
ncbi:MAG: DUF4956 domain-containing protein [Lachnospiraceae bacterium]|nr:DUF4956 domain-containing protein [Lachnospiraceae bacterium]